MWYSSTYCNPAIGDNLIGGDGYPIKELANLEILYGLSLCSTGLSESSRLMILDSSHRKILYWLDQKNATQRRTIKILKLLAALFVTLLISGNI